MNSTRKLLWLGAASTASLGLYLLLARRYPLGLNVDTPRATWAHMVEPTGLNALGHLSIYLGLTLLYLGTLRLLVSLKGERPAHPRPQITLILATWLACSAALVTAAPGGESNDIYDYIFRGRMMAEYGANPLVTVPRDLPLSTPYARYPAWRKNVDTYGPVWEASSAGVAVSVRQAARWLGWWQEHPLCPKYPESCLLLVVYVTGYRLLAIILSGICGWLVYDMVKRGQPSLAPMALAVWLLSPMLLVSTALGGHNDAVMLVLALAAWWLVQRERLVLALLALVLAAHVKLTALIWLPACLLWIAWRWGWRRALKTSMLGAAGGLALSWLLYAPFGGWGSLPRMLQERSAFLANSLWRILKTLLITRWGWQTGAAHQVSIGLPSLLFAVGALLIPLWIFNFRPKRWRSADVPPEAADLKLWRVLTVTSMLYLLIGSFWFQHWYILWALAPAALMPNSQFTRSVLPWLTFGALCSNVGTDFLLSTVMKTSPPILTYASAVAITWGPVLLAVAVLALGRYRRRTQTEDTAALLKLAND